MNKPMNEEQLTAYVLGELTPEEVKAVETALADDPTARRQVAELRATVAWTQDAYHAEAAMELTTEQRRTIEARAQVTANVVPISLWRRFRPVIGVGVAAAALVLVMTSADILPMPSSLRSLGHRRALKETMSKVADNALVAPPPASAPQPALSLEAESKQQHAQSGGIQNVIVGGQITARTDLYGASGQVAPAASAPAETASTAAPPFVEQRARVAVKADFPGAAKDEAVALQSVPGQVNAGVEVYQSYYYGNPYNDPRRNYWPGHNTESYKPIQENPFKTVASEPLSTFSIDVDTASYSNMRRFLQQGTLPPPDSVRIEELINYFDYDYAPPADRATPFAARITVAGCPWTPEHRLARIGIKGWEMPKAERPASNLVFLIDTSGSMQPENKLPLIKQALRLLVEALDERDRIAIVAYASASGLVLPSTPGNEKGAILSAIERLQAGGSTQGSAGIQQAYDVAMQNFLPGGTNRVILSTDGDFNVGVTNEGDLQRLIEDKAKSRVFLTVLGFGMGNLKDSTMQTLADKGNGNYAYIDSFSEAKKVLVDQLSGTLVTIAKDVKIQVEFNPAKVAGYRLLGYEDRMLAKEDFNDDKKDAGEIGAGHRVTALYEIIPAGMTVNAPPVDALKYQTPQAAPEQAGQPQFAPQPVPPRPGSEELLTLKIRYKQPTGDTSTKLEFPTMDTGMQYAQADPDFKFAASVAEFGMLLRRSQYAGNSNWSSVYELAQEGRGPDASGYRAEFLNLVQQAQRLAGNYPPPQPVPMPMPPQPIPMPAPVDPLRYAPQE